MSITAPQFQMMERVLGHGLRNAFTLKRGSRGQTVRALQLFLKEQGYDIKADGVFLDETDKALKAYQKQAGTNADGVVGSRSLKMISDAIGKMPAPPEQEPAQPTFPPLPNMRPGAMDLALDGSTSSRGASMAKPPMPAMRPMPPADVLAGGTTAGKSLANPPLPTMRPVGDPLNTAGTTSSAGATAMRPPMPNMRDALAGSPMIGSVPVTGFPDAGNAPPDWLNGGNTQDQWPYIPPDQRDQFYSPPFATPSFAGNMVPALKGDPSRMSPPWLSIGGDIPSDAMARNLLTPHDLIGPPPVQEVGPPQMPQHLSSPSLGPFPDSEAVPKMFLDYGGTPEDWSHIPPNQRDQWQPGFGQPQAPVAPTANPAMDQVENDVNWFRDHLKQTGVPDAEIEAKAQAFRQIAAQGQPAPSNPSMSRDDFMQAIMRALADARIEPQPKQFIQQDMEAPATPPPTGFTTPQGAYR